MRLGLFSTLTGAGSHELVGQIAEACTAGDVPGVEIPFLFVDRVVGESEATDAAVDDLARRFSFALVRVSAVHFEAEARKAARKAAAAGDEAALWVWRDAFYESHRALLPSTDVDLLLGDMWIWGAKECAERRGLNLHPALPGSAIGRMWYDAIWDLVADGADEAGVMLHRVTRDVDLGPLVAWCRYSLRTPELDPLWAALPAGEERTALVARERALKRETAHPLFHALRAEGLRREAPLMLETVRALAEGRLVFADRGVVDATGAPLARGLELTSEVEAALAKG
jgi:phosphoribosylglycinamide formyltransferase-1